MKKDTRTKTDYERALEIYNSLSPQQKLFVAPKGRFVDSPSLIYRHLAPKDTGFVEMYKFHPDNDAAFITLAVRPDKQGKGIGKYLIQKAIEKAKAREDINSIIYRADVGNEVSDKLGASTGKLKKKTPDFTEYNIDTTASNAAKEGFITPYLKTVSPDKLTEETFAEYMANQLLGQLPKS